jgi:hypothetical protein
LRYVTAADPPLMILHGNTVIEFLDKHMKRG